MFSATELLEIKGIAHRIWMSYPGEKTRLEGMDRCLTDDELRTLVFYEASLTYLSRVGAVSAEQLESGVNKIIPRTKG